MLAAWPRSAFQDVSRVAVGKWLYRKGGVGGLIHQLCDPQLSSGAISVISVVSPYKLHIYLFMFGCVACSLLAPGPGFEPELPARETS